MHQNHVKITLHQYINVCFQQLTHLIFGSYTDTQVLVISWREARSSIRRLVTGGGTVQASPPPAPNTKLSITHSFFELQSPDFAWKFVWSVRTNTRNTRNIRNTRNTRNNRNTRKTRKTKKPKIPKISKIPKITLSGASY